MDVLAKAITELREEHQHICEAILALERLAAVRQGAPRRSSTPGPRIETRRRRPRQAENAANSSAG